MEWLEKLGRDLALEHGAVAVLLYGSYARGTERSECDVDLFFLSELVHRDPVLAEAFAAADFRSGLTKLKEKAEAAKAAAEKEAAERAAAEIRARQEAERAEADDDAEQEAAAAD